LNISRPLASSQEDIEELAAALDRRYKRMGGDQFNGSTKYINTVLTVLSMLIVAAIIGGIQLYARVEGMSQKIENTNAKVDLILSGRIK
jgi:hypothetical protein